MSTWGTSKVIKIEPHEITQPAGSPIGHPASGQASQRQPFLVGVRRAVFFGAHTDDEMICAGTLHRLARMGTEVHVVTFAPAAIESDRTGGHASLRVVKEEWQASMKAIGATWKHLVDMIPSCDLQPYRQQICQFAYDYCEGSKPDLAFVLSPEDENTAHSLVGTECERVMRGRVPIVVRCQFPWNYSVGRSNLYVKLEPQDLEAKIKVIQCYKSQHFRYAYEEMLVQYAQADGLSVKVPAAEKFELLRGVI